MTEQPAFQDHFSRQAKLYAQYRPHYPPDLFTYLAGLAPEREWAWDCGAGNGQASEELAWHFQRVIATDPSARQIAAAKPHPKIDYRVAPAEESGLADRSVDLIAVAQAAHWFDLPRFFAEARRVARPNAILAIWGYHLPRIEPAIDALLDRLYFDICGPYWAKAVQLKDEHYRTLPFPFPEIPAPQFAMETRWNLEELQGYLGSWSSIQPYLQAHGHHPLAEIAPQLAAAWGDPRQPKLGRWPLFLRLGRITDSSF